MSQKIKEAMDTLREAMAEDPGYAWGWHCNIAMACMDSMDSATGIKSSHKTGNEAASRFMSNCFGVITEHPNYGQDETSNSNAERSEYEEGEDCGASGACL